MTTAAAAIVALAAFGCASSGDSDMEESAGTGSEFTEETVTEEVMVEETVAVDTLAALQTVYFDFDRYNIRPDARPVLQSNAELIKQSPGGGTVVVEGNCDERGSEEYNLALGERRAESVKGYLVDLGVSGGRLYTVSFGESKPAVMGHDETAWRYNRRVDFASR